MKVAIFNVTTTTQFGGLETFVWEVAARLAAHDVQVDLFGGNGTFANPLPPSVRVLKFPFVPRAWLRRMPMLGRSVTLVKFIERFSFGVMALPALTRGRYDLIHILKPYDLPLASFAKRLTGAKLLLGCQGTDYFPGDTLFTRFVDGSVACSHFNARQVLEHYQIRPIVVFNGYNAQRFKPMPRDASLRARFAGPSDSLLLFSGRLVGWKGVNHLLDALVTLAQNVKLLIAGEGEERVHLERQAHRLGIAERVFFLGHIEQLELPDLYAISDLVVLTSLAHETFSIVSCEALGCERPVIGTNVGAIPELVEELVPPGDADALASKIQTLLADSTRRAELARRGHEKVSSFLTWEATTLRLLEVYYKMQRGEQGFEGHLDLPPLKVSSMSDSSSGLGKS